MEAVNFKQTTEAQKENKEGTLTKDAMVGLKDNVGVSSAFKILKSHWLGQLMK